MENLASKYAAKITPTFYEGYIYLVFNTVNDYIYIGKRKGQFTASYKGSGRYIVEALKQFGEDKFNVFPLAFCEDATLLDDLEKYWIKLFRNKHYNMYNVAPGGPGGDTLTFLNVADKQRRIQKISLNLIKSSEEQSKLSTKAWVTRRKRGHDKMSDEQRRKISEANKGHKPSKESIDKMLATKKASNYVVSEETKKKISKSNKGKKLTESTKSKLRQAAAQRDIFGEKNPFYGKHHSAETKEFISWMNLNGLCGAKNTVWMNNGQQNKRIKQEEIDCYIERLCKRQITF